MGDVGYFVASKEDWGSNRASLTERAYEIGLLDRITAN